MAIVGTYTKSPAEQERVEYDATDALATGETVASATCVAYDDAGTNVSATLLSGTTSVVSPYVYQLVIAGTAGETYHLVFTATTSSGQIVQDTVRVDVVAAPPAIEDEVSTLRDTLDLTTIRAMMSANSEYDMTGNVDQAKRFVAACRRFLLLSENEIRHGNESVRKEENVVKALLDEARNWLIAKGAMPDGSPKSRVRYYSMRNWQ